MIAAASRWCSRSSRVARESSWSRSTASRRSPIRLRPARARCPSRRSNGATVVLRGSAAGRRSSGCGEGGFPGPASHRRAKEVLDLEPGALVDELGDAAAVATFRVALVAQQAEPAARGGERRERIELLARLWGREVLLVDAKKLVAFAAARRETAFLGGAERAQVQVADGALVEPGGELAFGKARPARGAHGAHVDDEIDLGLLQGVERGLRRGVLVADGEKRFHDKRVDKRGSAAWLVAASCCGFCHGIPKPGLRSPTRPRRVVAFYVTIPAIAATLRKPQPKLARNHIGPHRFCRLWA